MDSFCSKVLYLRRFEEGSIQFFKTDLKRHDRTRRTYLSLKLLCNILWFGLCTVQICTWIFLNKTWNISPPASHLLWYLVFNVPSFFHFTAGPLVPFCTSFQIENVNLINFLETQNHRKRIWNLRVSNICSSNEKANWRYYQRFFNFVKRIVVGFESK